jgi:chemotaxis methyl-accepting protein methylase
MTAGALEPSLQPLGALIEERLGLRFHPGNADLLLRGLRRIGAADPDGAAALCAELGRSPLTRPVWQRLIAEIAVGETYFFRHPEDFAVLQRRVVPALREAGLTRLRAWSAGCASGEEAYSLANCLGAAAGALGIEVLGTDLNVQALAAAERGVYGPRSLRGTAPAWESTLLPGSDGLRRVPSELRRRVRFALHNLAEPGAPAALAGSGCEVIFCRNVLLYFGASAAAKVLARLAHSLAPGGYLFVSPLDLLHPPRGLEPLELDGVWLLRKPQGTLRGDLRPAAVTPPLGRGGAPPAPPPDPVREARLAADQGDLERALQIARQAVGHGRTPEALHLLALILGEQDRPDEMRRLLVEAVTRHPGYVQGHLSLGLLPPRGPHQLAAAQHLARVLALLQSRADADVLAGPEPLRVSLARRLAQQGLENLRHVSEPVDERREPDRKRASGELP